MDGRAQVKSDLFWLPLLYGILPVLVIHLGYLVAAGTGQTDWCVPYWNGCTSVSRVARNPPSVLLFRGVMIPALTLGIVYWVMARRWLCNLRGHHRRQQAMMWCGVAGALFLILYNAAAGVSGHGYNVVRYTGVLFGIGLVYVAQLLQSLELSAVTRSGQGQQEISGSWVNVQWLAIWSCLAIGVISQMCRFVFGAQLYDDRLQNAFEWWLMLVINIHYVATAMLWRRLPLAVSDRL